MGWIPALPFTSWGTLVKPLTLELQGIRWGKRGILYRDEMWLNSHNICLLNNLSDIILSTEDVVMNRTMSVSLQ